MHLFTYLFIYLCIYCWGCMHVNVSNASGGPPAVVAALPLQEDLSGADAAQTEQKPSPATPMDENIFAPTGTAAVPVNASEDITPKSPSKEAKATKKAVDPDPKAKATSKGKGKRPKA